MTIRRRRPRRPDDWSTNHARARAAVSDRIDGVVEPSEASWLDEHLAGCADCRSAAVAYAAQLDELRAIGARTPTPPRDLWARTAAAIEHEARFRDHGSSGRRSSRRLLAPFGLLTAALVVAVVVGTLISSRRPIDGGPTPPPGGQPTIDVAAGGSPVAPGATPMLVGGQSVAWVSQGQDGKYRIHTLDVPEVCPDASTPCASPNPVENHAIDLQSEPSSVFGSKDRKQLIVANGTDTSQTATISVVNVPSTPPGPTPSGLETPVPTTSPGETPPASPTGAPTRTPTPTPTPTAVPPTSTPDSSATPAVGSPSPTVSISPSPSTDGVVEIASNVLLVGQSAAYSSSGTWFAFTARPPDGSLGPDIYVWKVGEPTAQPVTTDHRSEFGSWFGDMIVGSSVVDKSTTESGATQTGRDAVSFLLDPLTTDRVPLPQTGRTWLPSVDPSGRQAVYWTGSLRLAPDKPVYLPDAGRLVLADWGTGTAAPTEGPVPTDLVGNQVEIRHETTIVAGQIADWDARWDETGTRLAIWIASAENPTVGSLSLYAIDSFDGRIDLKKPLLDATPATAGFSISKGKLVWAEPAVDGSGAGGRILVLAWTELGLGTVETNTDNGVVIR